MKQPTRAQGAAQLRHHEKWVFDIDEGVAGHGAIQRCVRKRQARIGEQMKGHSLTQPRRGSALNGPLDELRIDVEAVHVPARTHAPGELHGSIPHGTAQVGHHVPFADGGVRIETFRCGRPPEHGLIALHAFRVDVDPVARESV